jgi:hypothetical protein
MTVCSAKPNPGKRGAIPEGALASWTATAPSPRLMIQTSWEEQEPSASTMPIRSSGITPGDCRGFLVTPNRVPQPASLVLLAPGLLSPAWWRPLPGHTTLKRR